MYPCNNLRYSYTRYFRQSNIHNGSVPETHEIQFTLILSDITLINHRSHDRWLTNRPRDLRLNKHKPEYTLVTFTRDIFITRHTPAFVITLIQNTDVSKQDVS